MTDTTEREKFELGRCYLKNVCSNFANEEEYGQGTEWRAADFFLQEAAMKPRKSRAALSQPAAGGAVSQVDISGSYVADDDTYPEMVMFSDGRIVAISHDNEEPYLVVSRKRDKDFSHILTAIGKERAEAWASIEASYKEEATLRATAVPDESRNLIEFVTRRFGLSLDITGKMLSVDDLHKAFSESRKR